MLLSTATTSAATQCERTKGRPQSAPALFVRAWWERRLTKKKEFKLFRGLLNTEQPLGVRGRQPRARASGCHARGGERAWLITACADYHVRNASTPLMPLGRASVSHAKTAPYVDGTATHHGDGNGTEPTRLTGVLNKTRLLRK